MRREVQDAIGTFRNNLHGFCCLGHIPGDVGVQAEEYKLAEWKNRILVEERRKALA